VEPHPDAESQLRDLARWLALRLGMMLAQAEAEVPQQDFPGWALSAGRVRAMLGEDIATSTVGELRGEWEQLDRRLTASIEAAAARKPESSPAWISHAFGLDRVEREMLWYALAPEMSAALAQAIGFLNDDLAQRRPTVSLLCELIDGGGPPWQLQRRLGHDHPLGRFRLLSLSKPDPLVPDSQAPLILAADIVAMLFGRRPGVNTEGATLYDPARFSEETFDLQVAPVLQAARAANKGPGRLPVVHFQAAAAEADWLAAQLASVGEHAIVGDIGGVASVDMAEAKERLLAFARAACAVDGVLIVAGLDAHEEERRKQLVRSLARNVAPHVKLLAIQGLRIDPVALREAPGGLMEISRPHPTREERVSIWRRAAAARGLGLDEPAANALAATFAFDRAQAEAAVALAQGGAAGESRDVGDEALRDAARIVSRASAPPSVRRVETGLGWDDLVLPAATKAELRSIPLQLKHGATVWDKWGFGERIPYGQATIALLAGPSGTGKTMAAQIIARELGAALFQVDLAKIVSKYIGETEKALDGIFQAAEDASAVLLFDEADALFGKRSDIHDAHDRYANIEVNFLLQRIEEHLAPVLLTTNRKANIDSAFLRRLNKVVDFPMPDEEQRGLIWKRLLPPEAFVADDARDMSAFRQLPLSGGGIANSVLAAAFMGAEDGGQIRMRHLVAAARGELAKAGMGSAARTLTHLIEGDRASGNEP
jgi:hypothetical protein